MPHNNESTKNLGLSFISTLIDNKEPSVNSKIFLVVGKEARHEHIFSEIKRLVNNSPKMTVMLIQLGESITTLNAAFHVYLMRKLAQTIEEGGRIPEKIQKIIKDYLNPFEVKEKTHKIGFKYFLNAAWGEKLVKKEIDIEDIKKDYQKTISSRVSFIYVSENC